MRVELGRRRAFRPALPVPPAGPVQGVAAGCEKELAAVASAEGLQGCVVKAAAGVKRAEMLSGFKCDGRFQYVSGFEGDRPPLREALPCRNEVEILL